MTRVIIIDDEPLARSIILDYLTDHPGVEVLAECGDGFEAAKAIMGLQPDLIFLDVQMPKISGFELLELLDEKPHTIFTTAFDEYAIRAFEQHAVDYLLKPISKDRFDAALDKFRQIATQQITGPDLTQLRTDVPLERIIVKTGTRIKIIPVEEIDFIQADDDYMAIHTADNHYLKKDTMASFEKRLDPAVFVRIHRSYMANVNCLDRIEPYERDSYIAILKSGKKLNVSKAGYARLKQILGI